MGLSGENLWSVLPPESQCPFKVDTVPADTRGTRVPGGRMTKHVRVLVIAVAVFAALVAQSVPALAIGGFGDTPVGEYYSEAVQWMVDGNLTQGTQPGCFTPNGAASRGEVATFIHRTKGSPSAHGEPFDDVSPTDYFGQAVAWMVATGITEGTSPTTFEPGRDVTRGEMATFLHRAEGSPPAGSTPFTDVPAGMFFSEAVAWMVAEGVTNGVSATTFEPNRPVTRAEVAAFLYRVAGTPPVTYTTGGECASAILSMQLDVAEAWSLHLLNNLRASLGEAPLARSGSMSAEARGWSQTMAATGDFKHSNLGYGENIAWWSWQYASPEGAADKMHELWVNSSGHYANMIRSSYKTMGSGFWRGTGGWHATHVFSR